MNGEMQTITLNIPKFEGYTPTGRLEQVTEGMCFYDGSTISKWNSELSSEHHYVTYTRDKWRAAAGGDYYTIDTNDGYLRSRRQVDLHHNIDNSRFRAGLYFENESQAAAVTVKMRATLRSCHREFNKP